ncbi:MAG: hypothetical protein DWQ01_05470 [Planctomycetota bacterium]|nr:MAG: hypothetical protein DWQ01_05470 [Planctomycetota bacterium]
MTDQISRIRKLVAEGRLQEQEGEVLIQAFQRQAQQVEAMVSTENPEEPAPALVARTRFLLGEIGASEYWAMVHRQAWAAGILFGLSFPTLLLFLGYFLLGHEKYYGNPMTVVVVWLVLAGMTGPLFGLLLYFHELRPKVLSLLDLRRQLGDEAPLEEEATAGNCPVCGHAEARHWHRGSPAMLHWQLNPGLAFNELVLGQRIPAEMSRCLRCKSDYLVCCGCSRSLDLSDWSGKRAFGKWQGFSCPYCQTKIPALRNGLAFVLLLPFYPLIWLKKRQAKS